MTGGVVRFLFAYILPTIVAGIVVQNYSKALDARMDAIEERSSKLEMGARAFEMRRQFNAGWAEWEAEITRYNAALATDTLPTQRAWWDSRIWRIERDLRLLDTTLAEYEGRPPRVIALRDSIAPAAVTDLRAPESDPWWYQQYAVLLDYYHRAHHKEK